MAPVEVGPPERHVAAERLGCRAGRAGRAVPCRPSRRRARCAPRGRRTPCVGRSPPRHAARRRRAARRGRGREAPRGCPGGGVDQALGFGRRERPRHGARPPRAGDRGGGIVRPWCRSGSGGAGTRGRLPAAARSSTRRVPSARIEASHASICSVVASPTGPSSVGRERRQVTPVRVHRPRRPARREEEQVALDVGVGRSSSRRNRFGGDRGLLGRRPVSDTLSVKSNRRFRASLHAATSGGRPTVRSQPPGLRDGCRHERGCACRTRAERRASTWL